MVDFQRYGYYRKRPQKNKEEDEEETIYSGLENKHINKKLEGNIQEPNDHDTNKPTSPKQPSTTFLS